MANSHEKNIEQQLLAYLRGELTEEEKAQLRKTLEETDEYADKLEQLLFHDWLEKDEDPPVALTEEKQTLILQKSKWRNRFVQSIFTVGGMVTLGILLFIVSQVCNYLWFWPTVKDITRVTEDVVHFTSPAMRMGSGGTNGGLFFSMDMKYTAEERLGGDSKQVGFVENHVLFNHPQLKFSWNNGVHKNSLYFRYPTAEPNQPSENTVVPDTGWRVLDKLPEGTVAQLAVSFTRLLTHDEYFAIIRKYDLDTAWFAVDTGQEAAAKDNPLGKGSVWGYNPWGVDYGGGIEVNGEGERRAQALIAEMEYLSTQKKWAEPMLKDVLHYSDPKLQQRTDYLKQHGVRLYGVVVTGPTKELLKLKQEPVFAEPYVGEVDWWNWDQHGARGREYSW